MKNNWNAAASQQAAAATATLLTVSALIDLYTTPDPTLTGLNTAKPEGEIPTKTLCCHNQSKHLRAKNISRWATAHKLFLLGRIYAPHLN